MNNETPVVTISGQPSYRKTGIIGDRTHSGVNVLPRVRLNLVAIVSFAVVLFSGILFARSGYAATFTVTRFDDIGIPRSEGRYGLPTQQLYLARSNQCRQPDPGRRYNTGPGRHLSAQVVHYRRRAANHG
jgi:hypothetical protein